MHVILELQGTRDMLAVGAHALAENTCSYLGIRNQQLVGRVVRAWLNNVVVHYFLCHYLQQGAVAITKGVVDVVGWYTRRGIGIQKMGWGAGQDGSVFQGKLHQFFRVPTFQEYNRRIHTVVNKYAVT